MSQVEEPSFNLWTEPWITVEEPDGTLAQASIEDVLLRAGYIRALYDPSPLVIVGMHRLLTAILQDALNPQRPGDLHRLRAEGCFPESVVRAFGEQYAHRFDLFAEEVPFLQSADLPRKPPKKGAKTVTYLMPQIPAGSLVTHYRHGVAEDNVFCPACAAQGLLTIPAFATSGGAGIRPSINGVPPIYVLPGGETLFESLAASLVLPAYQPRVASNTEDAAWWKREPIVRRREVVQEVSYLHSLTFPARRVRLHPEPLQETCSRCGRESKWGVRTMVYKMGEYRPKDAPFWFDPFAAYRIRGKKGPIPIRPQEGKALWREFASLFLPSPADQEATQRTQPPSVLYQLAEEGLRDDLDVYPFRCIGMRTDMRMKVFEWIDAGFDVPVALIQDSAGSLEVRQALDFATDCAGIIAHTFRRTFGGEGKNERHEPLKRRMVDDYWAALANPFRHFVLTVAEHEAREAARCAWLNRVMEEAKAAFETYSEMTGDDAMALRERVTGRRICSIQLHKKRKKALGL
jgi:CRISPR system Cascade subunit CasA